MSDKKITDFVPQVKNPNRHNTFGMRLLEKSIQDDGWIGAQTAAKDGEIIAGSARQEIAVEKFTDKDGNEVEPIVVESDGSRPVIIVRTDIDNADTARARRLSAAENQIAKSNYNPDFELLKEWGGEDEQIKKLFSDDEWRRGTYEGEDGFNFGGLPDQDRAPFRQVTFTLHDSQYEQIEAALKASKAMGAFTDSPNENSNGNAIARICETFLTEHGNS